MTERTQEVFLAEHERIRSAYAQRSEGSRYSFFNSANLFRVQRLEREVLRLLSRAGGANLADMDILEVGCGGGYWLRELVKWGARPERISGIDLRADSIENAKQLCPDGMTLRCGSAAALDWPDASFDLVLQFTVFTSILAAELRQEVAREMLRVLRPGGLVLWYDFHVNNPRNPDVRGVKRAEIHRLFPGCRIDLRRVSLAPPLARALAPWSWTLCTALEKVPWLCSHYLGAVVKP